MPDRDAVRSYAEVAIEIGLGLEAGDRVLMEVPRDLPDFARDLTEVAYERGAEDVQVLWFDRSIDRARFTHGRESSVDTVSGRSLSLVGAFESGASYLRVLAEDPAALAGTDPSRVGRFAKLNGKVVFQARAAQQAFEVPWTVISAPVPGWASSVFQDVDLNDATENMWSAIFRACRIDQPDPVAAWHAHLDDLVARRMYLTDRKYVALRYEGPGTDLELGLPGDVVWLGGGATTPEGRRFSPNIPTEEVFTSPHRSKAQGRVTATKPLSYFGSIIDRFWLELRDGEVVDSNADQGADVLASILATDEGSTRFGEAAMVPQSGTVAAEELVWKNALYDENDACHLALGQGFPTALKNGTVVSKDELLDAGLNQSAVHVDFVIGSPDVSVHGVTSDGTEEPIITKGEWGFTPR